MKLRSAKINDLDVLYELEKEVYEGNAEESKESIQERLLLFPEGYFILEDEEEKIIGAISGEIWNSNDVDESFFGMNHDMKKVHNPKGDQLYISNNAIFNKYQGNGYGSLMIKKFLDIMFYSRQSISICSLIVSSEWKAAIHLYKKLGFKTVKTLEDFFSDQDIKFDAHIMHLTK